MHLMCNTMFIMITRFLCYHYCSQLLLTFWTSSSSPLQVISCLLLLFFQLGKAGAIGCLLVFILVPVQYLLGRYLGQRQDQIMVSVQIHMHESSYTLKHSFSQDNKHYCNWRLINDFSETNLNRLILVCWVQTHPFELLNISLLVCISPSPDISHFGWWILFECSPFHAIRPCAFDEFEFDEIIFQPTRTQLIKGCWRPMRCWITSSCWRCMGGRTCFARGWWI